jgi:hypothetical protein
MTMARGKITTRCEQGVLPPLTSITRPMVKAWSAVGSKSVNLRVFPYVKTVSSSVGGFAKKKDAVAAVRKMLAAVALVLVLCLGCRGLAPTTPTVRLPDETEDQAEVRVCLESCRAYDDQYLVHYALGMTFSGVSAAAGTGGIMTSALADEPGADINWLSGEAGERFEDCKAGCLGETAP